MAAEQASRVLEVCASVEGDDAALNRALCEEFDINPIDAEVVLSLQVRRFTPASIARMRSELAEMERRIPDLDTVITVNVNGCPNACARTQIADIGLKGQQVNEDGKQVEGFQVHLGGGIGLQSRFTETPFGRKLRAHKVTSAKLDDYVENVVRHYLAEREDGEAFATWVARADEESLRGEAELVEVDA